MILEIMATVIRLIADGQRYRCILVDPDDRL